MSNLKKLTIAGAVALIAVVNSANAADYIEEPPVVELPPVEKFGGWYLRGDISVDLVDEFDTTYVGNSYTLSELEQGYNVGIGVGYQINEFFRADLTLERFASDFNGATVGGCASTGGVVIAGSCVSAESAEFSAWSAMANAYVDIGHFGGLTPYVGAGLGASYVSWDSYQSVNTCTRANVATNACYAPGNANYVAAGTGGTSSVSTVTYEGDQSWRFSYAIMAGLSYDLAENLKLDAGYKYTNIASGPIINDIGGGASVDHEELGVHAFRVGLRYQIW